MTRCLAFRLQVITSRCTQNLVPEDRQLRQALVEKASKSSRSRAFHVVESTDWVPRVIIADYTASLGYFGWRRMREAPRLRQLSFPLPHEAFNERDGH